LCNIERQQSKKSPPNTSPKKKLRFSTPVTKSPPKANKEESNDSSHETSEEVCDENENTITPDELDFFYGSTTFGKQVQQIQRENKKRRKSQ